VRGDEDALPPDHFITSHSDPTLAFIGFVRPNVGAIPPMSELQVLWWIQRLRGKIPAKRGAPTYGLLGKKLPYGVDYGNYMHQLAAEIGAAPTLAALARSPKALVAWSLGQAYVTFFRLVGPFAGDEHWEVASGELYRPVATRGIAANGIFLVTMGAFGAVNLALAAADVLLLAAVGKDVGAVLGV
jgi:dimethylaniline monooxygenase (N-oxide forming)